MTLRVTIALAFALAVLFALGFPAACDDGPQGPPPAQAR